MVLFIVDQKVNGALFPIGSLADSFQAMSPSIVQI